MLCIAPCTCRNLYVARQVSWAILVFWPPQPEASALGQGFRRIEPRRGAGRNQRAQQRREQRDADAERDVFGVEAAERGWLERTVREARASEPVAKRGRDPGQEE